MGFPGETNSEAMKFELNYWEKYGVAQHDLHLPTYFSIFSFGRIDYAHESIMDVGSGPISVFEEIAPASASIMPFDILADEYNRLVPEKKFMIHNQVPEDRPFSLITVFNMLDHVDDPDDILEFLQPLLHEDGKIWLAVHLYRPHGVVGHPQKFTCRSIVSLLSKYFSIESGSIIREGVPLPYMWYGVLLPKEERGRSRLSLILRNYALYFRFQLTRIIVKVLKVFGLRALLPQAWRF